MIYLKNKNTLVSITHQLSYSKMDDIISVFDYYISHFGSYDIAESEFKKAIHEDPELLEAYREWCDSVGSSEKEGFNDYCDEFRDSQDDVWNTLNDYEDE